MKTTLISLSLALLPAISFAAGTGELAIVPQPRSITRQAGVFKLAHDTDIYADSDSRQTAEYLAQRLRQSTGYPLAIEVLSRSRNGAQTGIELTTQDADPSLGTEGYELTVTPRNILIRAPESAGLFYGVQTLLQLLPPQIFSASQVTGADWQVPCVRISDQPRFKWRGLMLDVSRHFFNKEEIERLLDAMALHKMNRFHWHLVDDQGWRIQIKKYPKLTQIGAWRSGIGFGLDPKRSTAYGPDGRYGGYYTPQDIREVVAYAQARHITVVPEIEMPGHSTAALAAYPQFSCTGGPFTPPLKGGVFNGIYCPAKPATFRFLEDVLTEVFQLFPGQYVHIGGDEVPKATWKASAECQALMKREGLKNEDELQSWFIRRIAKFINAHGRTMIGWSEIMKGGLAKNAVVMDWIGGGREAAAAGHDVVMTPTAYCYFDHYQSRDRSHEPRAIGGYLPLRKVYSFEPMPAGLTPADQSHVLGAQANLWTEYIPSTNYLEYMIFPRLCALSEVVWSPKKDRNWDDFQRRLKVQEQRLDELGIHYRHGRSGGVGE